MNDPIETFDNLITHLNLRWQLHQDLFQGSEQYAIYNKSGSHVWRGIDDSILDSVFMAISRLLDPPKSCGHYNLSIPHMLKIAKPNSYSEILGSNYDDALAIYIEFIKPWRNKKLSHNDLETLTGNLSLPEVPYAHINDLIKKINEVGRYISLADKNVDRSFPVIVTGSTWVGRLFRVLKHGIAALPKEVPKRD